MNPVEIEVGKIRPIVHVNGGLKRLLNGFRLDQFSRSLNYQIAYESGETVPHVNKSEDTLWNVASAVGKSEDTLWNVASAVGKSEDTLWNVAELDNHTAILGRAVLGTTVWGS